MTIELPYALLPLTTTAPTACAPRCAAPSASGHSRYRRRAGRFDHWLTRAIASGVAPLQRLAAGPHAASEAVKAGVTLPWSAGPVAGHIDRPRMLDRSMFARARLGLLSRRFPRAA
jgi:transposase